MFFERGGQRTVECIPAGQRREINGVARLVHRHAISGIQLGQFVSQQRYDIAQ